MNPYKVLSELRVTLDSLYEAWAELNHQLNALEAAITPQGLVDIDKKANQWVLLCNECGEIGRFDIVPFNGGRPPTEVAWDAHEKQHRESDDKVE